ncbi:class I glutamine amidotransferase-like protein [Rhizodiscina lignyota]|uniref:Class I glutamine amidotransferase-like protein n=1 Tax=Rhizodiscina lignyota TaxID=1504668 RepID=A0A9P4IKF6_9PEZI|nr:class I glutamine amidotransferase-like protein [Rhizodiscina lignyota]
MKPPLRIAMLECDTPLLKTRGKYGGYGGVFKALFEAGADALNMPDVISSKKGMEITTWDVVNSELYPKLENVDVVLLTGSKSNAFDNDPWILKLVDFVKDVLAQDRIRIIGVCFGHQILGRAMGVKVDRGSGWEISVCEINLSAKGKELFKKDKLNLYQMHRDIVYGCPSDVEELGWSPTCSNQGMYVKGKVMTVQGHPEFTNPIETEIMEARHGQGIFDDATFEDGMKRVGSHHDGVAVAQAFIRFLLED